jgi:TonB family protein
VIRRISTPNPKYPDLPRGTRGSGVSIHEILIGPDGRVHGVWVLQELVFEPSFPAFEESIANAIRGWRYEPPKSEGRVVPACIAVTINVDWK